MNLDWAEAAGLGLAAWGTVVAPVAVWAWRIQAALGSTVERVQRLEAGLSETGTTIRRIEQVQMEILLKLESVATEIRVRDQQRGP